jgi:hypothetical protein
MPEIEETRLGSHRAMLIEDAAVLQRHQPAGKRDKSRSQRFMALAERCLLQIALTLRFVAGRHSNRRSFASASILA